ncbi:zinc-dependent alcohol dehydrogenase family protein [Planctomicrobium sp. SH664]|uniref:zinc-dependent alcohol dehydrogenase family protein n=1 Tax=Planctomicrobium sp. SH664 TaxID=3448125 RepID=UPI003F5B40D5
MDRAVFVEPGGGYDKVVLGNAPARAPQAGEMTVRLRASSLNYHDLAVVSGLWGPTERRIPMADGAGEVVAVGPQVTEFKVGDSVVSTFFPGWLDGEPEVTDFATVPGDGVDGYAREVVTVHTNYFTHAPKGWTHAQAATLTTAGLTAWRALVSDGQLKAGDRVLVQGTGGVSVFALQFAKAMGATVIATSSSEAKLERLKELGADEVLNYRETAEWGKKVLELTGGEGVDHVIEVGGPGTLEQSMIAARIGGHISLIGILTGLEGKLSVLTALIKQLRLQGVLVGNRQQQREMIRALDSTGIRPVIDRHFPLEEIVEAFRHQQSNQHFGKIVLDI